MSLRKWHRKYGYLSHPCRDFIANVRLTRNRERKFLVVRAIGERPHFYGDFLNFLEQELPEVRTRFRLKLCRSIVHNWRQYVLCIPWVQDPVKERDHSLYRRLLNIERQCTRRGVPVANPVERLSNSIKTTATRLISEAGCRVAKIRPVGPLTLEARATEIGFPFFIREDRRHGGPTFLLNSEADLASVPWDRFRHPCAVEFIDTKFSDGLYRRYRYISAGDFGAPLNLMIGPHWLVRQATELRKKQHINEDIDYMSKPDSFAGQLQAARQALGFDFCAFDYSIDRNNELVVWEANPYPVLPIYDGEKYRHPAVKRGFAIMAAGYLQRAGLELPEELMRMLQGPVYRPARRDT
ncbi:MAG: hypothetical protein U5R46_01455 [Gammaproteobacteria bacterium]|nr:hypothetical protein [Gammaproteobacteria bacterium]